MSKTETATITRYDADSPAPRGLWKHRNCSVARTLDIIEDSWTFAVIREAFFGVHTFEKIRENLGIPRATLTERLRRLVEFDILKKVAYSSSGTRFEYRFTRKGVELYPVMLALIKWGDDWLLEERESPPLALYHKSCENWVRSKIVCSECGEEIHAHDATYRDGPGAGFDAEPVQKRNRRSRIRLGTRLGRGCSVGRSLDIIADRWTFMVMRETFFGIRRYDDFSHRLGIASNILADRLQRLVDHGLLRREKYQTRPDRYEYRQTPMGADLYGAYLTMIAWADKWLMDDRGLPLILHHKTCGKDFSVKVVCSYCNEPMDAWDVTGKGF